MKSLNFRKQNLILVRFRCRCYTLSHFEYFMLNEQRHFFLVKTEMVTIRSDCQISKYSRYLSIADGGDVVQSRYSLFHGCLFAHSLRKQGIGKVGKKVRYICTQQQLAAASGNQGSIHLLLYTYGGNRKKRRNIFYIDTLMLVSKFPFSQCTKK